MKRNPADSREGGEAPPPSPVLTSGMFSSMMRSTTSMQLRWFSTTSMLCDTKSGAEEKRRPKGRKGAACHSPELPPRGAAALTWIDTEALEVQSPLRAVVPFTHTELRQHKGSEGKQAAPTPCPCPNPAPAPLTFSCSISSGFSSFCRDCGGADELIMITT